MSDVLERVAEANGVTREEVEKEIQKAIKEAHTNCGEQGEEFWKCLSPNGEEPSVEETLEALTLLMSKRKK